MRALVFQGPQQRSLEQRPKPVLAAPGDAIVRITRTTICGTDLHILKGDVPSCQPGTTLGHEGVGVVDAVGAAVAGFQVGDRVLISCITSCGRCEYCRRAMYSHCLDGGWILGNKINGTQAEFVRVPHADFSLYRIPHGVDEAALAMLSDILPTGFECGVLNGKVQPGSNVAIVGSGPIGLAALMTAQFFAPASLIVIDPDSKRLALAHRFGATHVMAPGPDTTAQVMALTDGRGADTVIEAVGIPASFELCEALVAPGGVIANVGVHGQKVDLHLQRLWSHNISITTRLVDTVTIPQLMKAVHSHTIDAGRFITHRFPLAQIEEAYATFAATAASGAIKVVIEVSD